VPMNIAAKPLSLFEAVGIEIEYMIVDRDTLRVMPVADRVLEAEAGSITTDVEFEDITWSNELVLHLIELKVTEPVARLSEAIPAFERHVARVNGHLEALGARLLPTAMHPAMDPATELRLWPHDFNAVYETFHRIFDCRGHGWANLQAMHVNLPFYCDEEFGRLHAAIRLILPILPALAASSPIMDRTATGLVDNRLAVYRSNCARIPRVGGRVIPEPVFAIQEYHDEILGKIYRDLAPHDPDGIIQEEWVNARGAIARFERNTIEIRLIDTQECPTADLAVAAAETWADAACQQSWEVEPLAEILEETIRDGDRAVIRDPAYLKALGWAAGPPCTGGRLWRHLLDEVRSRQQAGLECFEDAIEILLREGPLARRILRAVGPNPPADRLDRVYRRLCDHLSSNTLFTA